MIYEGDKSRPVVRSLGYNSFSVEGHNAG